MYVYIYIYILYLFIYCYLSFNSYSNNTNNSNTVSFHNFKSQNFKLSVSNPKSKYVAYLSVLSQISNCQSLGRKNNYEILKTDRSHSRRSFTAIFHTKNCQTKNI